MVCGPQSVPLLLMYCVKPTVNHSCARAERLWKLTSSIRIHTLSGACTLALHRASCRTHSPAIRVTPHLLCDDLMLLTVCDLNTDLDTSAAHHILRETVTDTVV